MEFFELDFTCSVFDPETNVVRIDLFSRLFPLRQKLAQRSGNKAMIQWNPSIVDTLGTG